MRKQTEQRHEKEKEERFKKGNRYYLGDEGDVAAGVIKGHVMGKVSIMTIRYYETHGFRNSKA